MPEQRLQDIATLAPSPLLSALPPDEIGQLLSRLTPVLLSEGAVLESGTDAAAALHFVLEGEQLERLFLLAGIRS